MSNHFYLLSNYLGLKYEWLYYQGKNTSEKLQYIIVIFKWLSLLRALCNDPICKSK